MSLRPSTRTLAPVLVFAVLGGIFATFMLTRLPSPSDTEHTVIRPKLANPAPVKKKTKAPVKAVKPAAKPKPKAKAKAAPAPVRVPVAKPAAPAKPVEEQNRVVVVGLYDPDSAVDKISLDEARAGAQAAGVGFVALNVFAEAQSRPLVKLLGALENPGVLVYRRPNTLVARFSGFADGDTVAQAAANARR